MKTVLALVEGQTEEAFVGRVLRPHLWVHGVDLASTIVVTKNVPSGPNTKGGVSSWARIQKDLRPLLGHTGAVAVTTMFDYYALPADIPGMLTRPPGSARDRVRHVQAAIDAEMGNERLRSHLMLHEFEALLFADPTVCGSYLSNPGLTAAMTSAVGECGEPELVNESPATAPSRRIVRAHGTFNKRIDGPVIAESIGLPRLRERCPHFDAWVSWLEDL